MRRLTGLFLVIILMLGAITVVGCGSKKATVKIGDEEVEYTEKDGEVTLETEEGKMTTSTDDDVSEEDLGCPIYPDAEMEEGAAGTIKMNDADGKGEVTAAAFYTDDSVSEVVAWYKDNLAGRENLMDMSTSAGGQEAGMFTFGSGDEGVSVVIAADQTEKGKTTITITRGAGTGNVMNNED